MIASSHSESKTYALWFASKGFKVFPCKAKAPITSHGWQDATLDPAQIIAWWDANPSAQIGVNPGPGSLVLDVDPRHGGDKTLADLVAKHGKLPITPTVSTGGGGHHYWFKSDAQLTSKSIAQGLDVKASNGYVIAPPSIHHETGKAYAWLHGLDTPTADAPPWLVTMATTATEKAEAKEAEDGSPITFFWRADTEDLALHPGHPMVNATRRCAVSWAFT